MESQNELLSVIDIEKRTTRGRACPRCGGKIIPSKRAVYQSTDPTEVFPLWQCERCGYEELVARAVKPAAKHAAPAKESPAAQVVKPVASSPGSGVSTAASSAAAARTVPALKDRKGRALPPDVNRILAELNAPRSKES